eukprot:scaffold8867_cov118-Isochrysis_galbana.AAC.4
MDNKAAPLGQGWASLTQAREDRAKAPRWGGGRSHPRLLRGFPQGGFCSPCPSRWPSALRAHTPH